MTALDILAAIGLVCLGVLVVWAILRAVQEDWEDR